VKVSAAVLIGAVALLTLGCNDKSPTGPSSTDMTGAWSGASTYPNSPFELSLTQTNGTLRGQYRDALDRSLAVTGTFTAPTFAIVVDFGDAKLNLNGSVLGPRSAQGVMFTSALGNRQFPFTMTR
jgi:hypothetical protein